MLGFCFLKTTVYLTSMDFQDIVKEDMEKVEQQIEDYITKRDARTYGFLLPFIRRGGKRIRPLVALLCFRAYEGKETEEVKKVAAIIEMFHNFTLIHDDIEDNSKFRRGEPTLHVQEGIAAALNSGDALYTLIWKEMAHLDIDEKRLIEIMKMCTDAYSEVADGQGLEIHWESKGVFDITEDDYFNMIEKKTAALIGLCCRVGAYLAGASEEEQKAAENFGRKIGIAFQIHDDVLNISGKFETYQKEIGGDITEGKRTLMVVKVLENGEKEDVERLKNILSSSTENADEIKEAIEILKKYDTLDYAENKAKKLVEDAKDSIKELKDSRYKEGLMKLSDFVVTREK